MLKRVVVTGAAGMLGSALIDCAPGGHEVVGVDLAEGDITTPQGADAAVASHRPDAVIHCAAYTDVDGCTRDPEKAHLVNAEGTRNVAAASQRCGAYLIVVSTDYVFDGSKGTPYTEDDEPGPLSAYGESKLVGEKYAAEVNERTLIARTQWLYGPNGKNFVQTIVNKGRELGELRVVSDEHGSPTYTRDLAARLWGLVERQPLGVLHCTNSGICTWWDLACAALEAAGAGDVKINRISKHEWESPTTRPEYSPLVSVREADLGLTPMRAWLEAVREYAAGL